MQVAGTWLGATLLRTITQQASSFFSSRRRHPRFDCDWSSDVCSSDLIQSNAGGAHRALAPLGDLLGTLEKAPVGRRADRQAVPVSYQINHGYLYIHTGQALDAISPLTVLRGFLAATL